MPATADDAAVITGRLGNGAPFVPTGSWAVFDGSGNGIEVYGSDGTAVIRDGVVKAAQKGDALAEMAISAKFMLDASTGGRMVAAWARLFENVAAVVDGGRPATVPAPCQPVAWGTTRALCSRRQRRGDCVCGDSSTSTPSRTST